MPHSISKHPPLTAQRLRQLLRYDAQTGDFTWLVGTARLQLAGRLAGTGDRRKYNRIGVDGRQYPAHRLAWLYVHGSWPESFIDHINGVKKDNRIANLREATNAQNMQNMRRPRGDGSSGFLGVTWHGDTSKWQAQIKTGGKNKYLGLFDTAEAAHEAYLNEKAVQHPFQTLKEVA